MIAEEKASEMYQAQIVGKDTVPRAYGHRSFKWDFLTKKLGELQVGQVVRLVLPKGETKNGACTALYRYARRFNLDAHRRVDKQENGSTILFLWCSNGKQVLRRRLCNAGHE